MDKKKKDINIDNFLVDKLMKKQIQTTMKITTDPSSQPEVKYFEHDDPSAHVVSLALERANDNKEQDIRDQQGGPLMSSLWRTSKKAENLMAQNIRGRIRLSKEVIIEYHKILMNDPSIGGIVRKENVQIAKKPLFQDISFSRISNLCLINLSVDTRNSAHPKCRKR